MDYYELKRDTLNAVADIGALCRDPYSIAWLDGEQRRRLAGKNFVTDERWQFRLLADRSILVEISFGVILSDQVLGLTVFHRDPESRQWDHERSKACFSVEELVEALAVLDKGREVSA